MLPACGLVRMIFRLSAGCRERQMHRHRCRRDSPSGQGEPVLYQKELRDIGRRDSDASSGCIESNFRAFCFYNEKADHAENGG